MKVAFIVPFSYEMFFQDVQHLWKRSDEIEEKYLSQRYTFHINWCRAMKSAGMDVTFYHLSYCANTVKSYRHHCGIKMKRVPVNLNKGKAGKEISITLLKEINNDKPDIVFSVTHLLNHIIDMCDILSLYCNFIGYPLISRNPAADTYESIFFKAQFYKTRFLNINKKESKKVIKYLYFFYRMIVTYSKSHLKSMIKKYTLSKNSIIITQTKSDYENLVTRFNINVKNVHFLPKPVDMSNFYEISKKNAAEKLGLDYTYKYILYVSNLHNTKGCEHVIDIMPDLINIYHDIRFIIIGGGHKRKELETLAVKKGVGNFVLFPGQVEHSRLMYYYNVADVFVLPTERVQGEGQPNVLLEAIACNTPAISTNIPGPSSILKEGLGVLVSINNKNELLLAIRRVLDGKYHISNAKRMEFLENYSLKSIGKKLNYLFTSSIKRKNV